MTDNLAPPSPSRLSLSQEKQDRIWDYFQDNLPHYDVFQGRARYAFIARQIPSGARALNIGVGKGGLERLLLKNGVDTYSLDPSAVSIEKIRSALGSSERAQVGYSDRIPFPDRFFDIVIMSEVLEHLDDDVLQKTIHEVRRVLKDS